MSRSSASCLVNLVKETAFISRLCPYIPLFSTAQHQDAPDQIIPYRNRPFRARRSTAATNVEAAQSNRFGPPTRYHLGAHPCIPAPPEPEYPLVSNDYQTRQ